MKRIGLSLLLLALSACSHKIQHGLDEPEANELETVLTAAGIDARKVREPGRDARWAIEVPESQTTAAIRILSEAGLPRRAVKGLSEVYGSPGLVPTAAEERARFILALSGEISRTLTAIPGVVHARVHLVTPPSGPPSTLQPPVRPTASILVSARHGARAQLLDMRSDLQALVAGAVDNLAREDVSVVIAELPPPPAVEAAAGWTIGRLALVVATALVALLATALVLLALQNRRLRLARSEKEVSEEEPGAAALAA